MTFVCLIEIAMYKPLDGSPYKIILDTALNGSCGFLCTNTTRLMRKACSFQRVFVTGLSVTPERLVHTPSYIYTLRRCSCFGATAFKLIKKVKDIEEKGR
jgi:hypothetical protein